MYYRHLVLILISFLVYFAVATHANTEEVSRGFLIEKKERIDTKIGSQMGTKTFCIDSLDHLQSNKPMKGWITTTSFNGYTYVFRESDIVKIIPLKFTCKEWWESIREEKR